VKHNPGTVFKTSRLFRTGRLSLHKPVKEMVSVTESRGVLRSTEVYDAYYSSNLKVLHVSRSRVCHRQDWRWKSSLQLRYKAGAVVVWSEYLAVC